MNSFSLYNMSNEYQSLLSNLINYETGEINQEADAQLTALMPAIENKCLAMGKFIKSLEAEKKELDFIKQEILKREAAYDKKINRMVDYLETHMRMLQINEIKSPFFTLKIKENPYSTEILDETEIPEEFMVKKVIEKVEVRPDKKAIKDEYIKTGRQIPGARVHRHKKLHILVEEV